MVVFIKKSGSYFEMLNSLGLLQVYGSKLSSTKEVYLRQIDVDIDRIPYFPYGQSTIEEIKDRLKDISHLFDETRQTIKPNKDLMYAQGDFFAGSIGVSYLNYSKKYSSTLELCAEHELRMEDYYKKLELSYIDDDGHLCGVSFSFLAEPLVDTTKLPFILSFIRNTTASPKDREVTTIMHPDLSNLELIDHQAIQIPESPIALSTTLDDHDLTTELDILLNSKKLSKFLNGLIVGESIARRRFDEISQQLPYYGVEISTERSAAISQELADEPLAVVDHIPARGNFFVPPPIEALPIAVSIKKDLLSRDKLNVAFIGSGGSSFILKTCNDRFSPTFISTVGIDFKKIELVLTSGKKSEFRLFCSSVERSRIEDPEAIFFMGCKDDPEAKRSSVMATLDEYSQTMAEDRELFTLHYDNEGELYFRPYDKDGFNAAYKYLPARIAADLGKDMLRITGDKLDHSPKPASLITDLSSAVASVFRF